MINQILDLLLTKSYGIEQLVFIYLSFVILSIGYGLIYDKWFFSRADLYMPKAEIVLHRIALSSFFLVIIIEILYFIFAKCFIPPFIFTFILVLFGGFLLFFSFFNHAFFDERYRFWTEEIHQNPPAMPMYDDKDHHVICVFLSIIITAAIFFIFTLAKFNR